KCMALDGAGDGVRVNCVCPGYTETPMIEGYFADQQDPEEARRFATQLHPLGRLGDPRDIADAMVYLASDEAGWVTGTALAGAGGLPGGIWRCPRSTEPAVDATQVPHDWDNSREPAIVVQSGDVVHFDLPMTGQGQVSETSKSGEVAWDFDTIYN